jgi:hypothetical protein
MRDPNPENFNTTRPLQIYPTGYSNPKKDAWYLSDFKIIDIEIRPQKLDYQPELLFSIETAPRNFTKLDTLMVKNGGDDLFHKRIVKKMLQICPDDFQALPTTIINHESISEQFKNHDYYLLNILHFIDAIDEERSSIRYRQWEDGTPRVNIDKRRFRDDCWEGHLIARDRRTFRVLWHPLLAREFAHHKSIQFLADDEIE